VAMRTVVRTLPTTRHRSRLAIQHRTEQTAED
jgi:hypothetical protein